MRWVLYGRRAGLVIVALLALYLTYKYFQRWRFLRNLRINRVTPEQVRDLLATGCGLTDCRFAAPGGSGAGGY